MRTWGEKRPSGVFHSRLTRFVVLFLCCTLRFSLTKIPAVCHFCRAWGLLIACCTEQRTPPRGNFHFGGEFSWAQTPQENSSLQLWPLLFSRFLKLHFAVSVRETPLCESDYTRCLSEPLQKPLWSRDADEEMRQIRWTSDIAEGLRNFCGVLECHRKVSSALQKRSSALLDSHVKYLWPLLYVV